MSDPEPADNGTHTVMARLVRSADFERVLRTRSQAQSAHFAVHHLPDRPSAAGKPSQRAAPGKLSTETTPMPDRPVDDLSPVARSTGAATLWLGAVVPKRHARRSVTRTLLKRQIRAAVNGQAGRLAGGLWVVRLRAPFDRSHFISAASIELKRSARVELDHLMYSAAQRGAGR